MNAALAAEWTARGHALVRPGEPADVTVRHRWPPDFAPPPAGYLALMQPWEYGALPRAWVEPVRRHADEVWAYSDHVRQTYLAAGLPPDRVHVVPLGVDPDRFRPGRPRLPLATTKRLRLLFVGGTIRRKGFDRLLTAYARAFARDDDVCLVVKDMGVGTFYRGQTAEHLLDQFRADPTTPEVEYLTADLPADDLPRLYAACHALVHPYRAEGFGLPVLEAMACGLPVVVTAGGPTDEFVPPAAGWRVPARVAHFPEDRVDEWETVGRPWWLEPDVDALTDLLGHLAAHPNELRVRGAAARRASLGFTWARTAATVEARVREMMRRPPLRETASAPAAPRVSLTMIVKDEEHNLPACLAGVAGLFDEVIVADTGSSDRTREVAAGLGAVVVEAPWADSFAAARNAALAHAAGDFAFWLDADDRVDPANREKLRTLFAGLDPARPAAAVVKCRCVPDRPGGPATVVDHVRLFPVRPDVRWEFRVHEQILPALRRAGVPVGWADAAVDHVGYADPAVRRRKLDRDLRLLTMELADRPDHPFTLFNLGSVHLERGDPAAALGCLERSLAGSDPRDSIVRKLYALVAQSHRELGRPAEALAAVRAGREHYPADAELLFLEGTLLRAAGDLPGAEAAFGRLLQDGEGAHFASVDDSLRGVKARHGLAGVLLDQGRLADAAAEWGAVLAADPGFVPALVGLGEVAVRGGDDRLLGEVLAGLDGPAPIEATSLRARRLLAAGEFDQARQVIRAGLDRFPADVSLLVLWSEVWLRDGRDDAESERALRAVLGVAPDHPTARHNLDLLLGRRDVPPSDLHEALPIEVG